MVSIVDSGSRGPRFNYLHSRKKFQTKIFDVAEVNQQRCFGENGQCLENFYQTHLVLASGKLVLQKRLHSLSLNLFGTVQIVGLFVRGKKSTS